MIPELKKTNFININNIEYLKQQYQIKQQYPNMFTFGKQDFKSLIGQKDAEKLDLYAYSVQK